MVKKFITAANVDSLIKKEEKEFLKSNIRRDFNLMISENPRCKRFDFNNHASSLDYTLATVTCAAEELSKELYESGFIGGIGGGVLNKITGFYELFIQLG